MVTRKLTSRCFILPAGHRSSSYSVDAGAALDSVETRNSQELQLDRHVVTCSVGMDGHLGCGHGGEHH